MVILSCGGIIFILETKLNFGCVLTLLGRGGAESARTFFKHPYLPEKSGLEPPRTQAPPRSPIRANFGEVGEGLMGIELSTLIVLLTNHRPFL